MDNNIISEGFDLMADGNELQNFITILKDAVEQNDNSCYLLQFIEIIEQKLDNIIDNLETYNQKIGQIIISQ